jgi:SPRY domain
MSFYLLNIYSGAVIGFCQDTAPLERLPGWDDSSWGYHGDSGEVFHAHSYRGRMYAEGFGMKDVVGCCVMPEERTVYFTKNGKRLRMSRSYHPLFLHDEVNILCLMRGNGHSSVFLPPTWATANTTTLSI